MKNCLQKPILLILRYQALVDQSLKHGLIQTSKVLKVRLQILTKRYPVLVRWSKILTLTQKLQGWKTRYLVLLNQLQLLLSILDSKATETKYKIPDVNNLGTKAALIQRLQVLTVKYLVLAIWLPNTKPALNIKITDIEKKNPLITQALSLHLNINKYYYININILD